VAKTIKWNEDLRGHPDRAENERMGFAGFSGVREHYDVAPGGVMIGRGNLTRWYAPITHPELPQMIASLAEADDHAIVAFAETYGELGYAFLTPKFYTWPDGQRTMGGDPLDWIRAHGRTVRLCLELTEAINANDAAAIDAIPHGDDGTVDRRIEEEKLKACRSVINDPILLSAYYTRWMVAKRDEVLPQTVPLDLPPFTRARVVRAAIINANMSGVRRRLTVRDGSVFTYGTMIEVVYWQLADLVVGGIVARCQRPGCGALFIQRHRSQRYCAPKWSQRESPCALWVRQRKYYLKNEIPPGRARRAQPQRRRKNATATTRPQTERTSR
jgi:hypothetical protein